MYMQQNQFCQLASYDEQRVPIWAWHSARVRTVMVISHDRFLFVLVPLCSSHWFEVGGKRQCHIFPCISKDLAAYESKSGDSCGFVSWYCRSNQIQKPHPRSLNDGADKLSCKRLIQKLRMFFFSELSFIVAY